MFFQWFSSFFMAPEVATMMSAEILGKHVVGRLDWGDPALSEPVKDRFADAAARSQVVWT